MFTLITTLNIWVGGHILYLCSIIPQYLPKYSALCLLPVWIVCLTVWTSSVVFSCLYQVVHLSICIGVLPVCCVS